MTKTPVEEREPLPTPEIREDDRNGTLPVVEVQGVTKQFGRVTALHEVNLCIYRSEFLTLLGPSGCGKTTLLRIIAGMETPTTGRVIITGRDMTSYPPEKRPLNMVFQRYALFPHLSVAENVAFGLRLKRVPEAEIAERVRDALALVRLEGFGERMPHQISGGQAQRVALVRALVNRPEVLLLDEPLSALDRKIRHQMQEELRIIQSEVGTTFLYVTHDQDEAMTMSTRIALMRDGRVSQIACPEDLYRHPASEFAANFIGDANLLEGCVAVTPDGPVVEWCGVMLVGLQLSGRGDGERVRLMARPEVIQITRDTGAGDSRHVQGTIIRSFFYGFYWIHRVRVDETGIEVVVRESEDMPGIRPGSKVWLSLDTSRTIVLSPD